MDGIILTLTNHLAANWNKIMQYRESIIVSGAHASTIPPEIVVTLDWEINFCKDISTHVSLCIGLCIPSNVLLEMMDNMNPVYY